ncbi:MAG: hypothetical protein FWG82_02040 [Oscillospiraceae bacterium]|nr:hypothetical protein [Oscillospiraceae bacterium]
MSAWNAKIGRTVLQKDSFWAVQDIHISDGNLNTLSPSAAASLNYLGILKFYKTVRESLGIASLGGIPFGRYACGD